MPVQVRRAEVGDAPGLAALLVANRELLAGHGGDVAVETPQRQAELIRERRSDPAHWPGVITVDGRVAGRMNLQHIVRLRFQSATVGYWVGEEFGGQGVATTALAQVMDVAFGKLGLHRLDAGTQLDNLKSQKVLRANGFEEIGVARGYLFLGGAWRDHLLFQRLAGE